MSIFTPKPASDISFISPLTSKQYLSLSMAQVKRLRARGKFHAFTDWARARHDRKYKELAADALWLATAI